MQRIYIIHELKRGLERWTQELHKNPLPYLNVAQNSTPFDPIWKNMETSFNFTSIHHRCRPSSCSSRLNVFNAFAHSANQPAIQSTSQPGSQRTEPAQTGRPIHVALCDKNKSPTCIPIPIQCYFCCGFGLVVRGLMMLVLCSAPPPLIALAAVKHEFRYGHHRMVYRGQRHSHSHCQSVSWPKFLYVLYRACNSYRHQPPQPQPVPRWLLQQIYYVYVPMQTYIDTDR